MRVDVLGAGPAGLYAAILIRRRRPDARVRVFEQNPPDATFGFGVVFSDAALEFLAADDPETVALIEPHLQRWPDIAVVHRGERVAIDGVGFSGIGRLELLTLLRGRATELGATLAHGARLEDLAAFDGADLVIGADGVNSTVRDASPDAFGARVRTLGNRFVWYGAARGYDALTQTFIDTPHGPMNAHHYSYAPDRATFVVETTPESFERAGFADMREPEYRAECERLFADALGGAPLIPNRSEWRRFPVLRCERWHAGNRVLVGDALHTAHFSIGSGTRLALEDVVALVRALEDGGWDVPRALPAYEAARRPVLEKITAAASASARWYERFDEHMALEPWPFALSYLRRAGRLDAERLRRLAPRFADALAARGVSLELAA